VLGVRKGQSKFAPLDELSAKVNCNNDKTGTQQGIDAPLVLRIHFTCSLRSEVSKKKNGRIPEPQN